MKLGTRRPSKRSTSSGRKGPYARPERPSARLRLDADPERRKKVVNMVFVSFRNGLTVYRRTHHSRSPFAFARLQLLAPLGRPLRLTPGLVQLHEPLQGGG